MTLTRQNRHTCALRVHVGPAVIATQFACVVLSVLAAATACTPSSPPLPEAQVAATAGAPTTQAASTAAGPTLAAVQTQASRTVEAEATVAAPTAAAAATRAAPTLQALSTVAALPTVPVSIRTAVARSQLQIAAVGTNQSDPTITVRNDGQAPVSLSGWTFLVGNSSVLIPTTSTWTVPAKSTVTLHLSRGSTKGDQVYLGFPAGTAASELVTGKPVTLVDTKTQPVSVYNWVAPTISPRP